jgi:hypothetical protein
MKIVQPVAGHPTGLLLCAIKQLSGAVARHSRLYRGGLCAALCSFAHLEIAPCPLRTDDLSGAKRQDYEDRNGS